MRNDKYTFCNFIVGTVFVSVKAFFAIFFQEVFEKERNRGKKGSKREKEEEEARKEHSNTLPSLLQ